MSLVCSGADRAEAPSRQASCAVFDRAPGFVGFDCAATHGSSGASVFDLSGGRARIVSLVPSGGSGVAFGMDLPAAVDILRRALTTGDGVFPNPEMTPRRLTPGPPGPGDTSDTGAKLACPRGS